jgi:hypothetical protein
MKSEHIHRLKSVSDKYGVGLDLLIDQYSHLQTRYLSRDLKAKKPIYNIIMCGGYGERAIDVIERAYRIYAKRSGGYGGTSEGTSEGTINWL